jgi:predicted secreted protein
LGKDFLLLGPLTVECCGRATGYVGIVVYFLRRFGYAVRMKGSAFLLLAAAALLATPVHVRAKDTPLEPVIHQADDKKTTASLRTTGEIKIVLPATGEAGYEWQIIANDTRILKPTGALKFTADPKAAGKAGEWAVTFVAQRPGRSTLRFAYVHPSENGKDETPADVREVEVTVK